METSPTDSKKEVTHTTNTAVHELPPIADLFRQSWERMTAGALNGLFLGLLSFAAYFGVFFLAFMIFLGITASTVNISEFFNAFKEMGPAALGMVGPGAVSGVVVAAVFLIVACLLIGSVLSGAYVYAFAWAEKKPTLGALLKEAFKHAGWFVLYSLLASLFAVGGFFFFVLPALIFGLFAYFGMYELLLENKKPFTAIKNSFALVAANFGPILGRVLIFILGYCVVAYLLPAIFSSMGDTAESFYGLVNMIISLPLSWFSVSYMITLYKHAKAATPNPAPRNGLFWTVVSLCLVGWIFFVVMGSFIMAMVGGFMKDLPQQNTEDLYNMQELESLDQMQPNLDMYNEEYPEFVLPEDAASPEPVLEGEI